MRKLIVDAQLFQTAAWHRGMGKYSVELLSALDKVQGNTWDSVKIILSKNIPIEDEVVPTIKKKIPHASVAMLDMLPDEIGNRKIPEHNRRIIDEYVAAQGDASEVDFLILSIMQGVIYPTFPSSGLVHKSLLFYDIIPFMFHDVYLRNDITKGEYLPRIGELLQADTYLAISKTVANDLAIYLGIDKSRIINIDGGAIKHSTKEEKLEIEKPFILMPTGNDLRKNNRRAILGFEEFNKRHGNSFSLVITSFFKEHEVAELSALSSNVIFTGNISGEQMNYLYVRAKALLFPPEYEGLGMPILEALEKGKPVACSNISVFREMSHTAFKYFDPYSVLDIAEALAAVTKKSTIDQAEYNRVLRKYTWENSAKALIKATQSAMIAHEKSRKKLAVFGPDPAYQDGAGKIMQENHAELMRLYDVEYYLEPAAGVVRRPNYLPYVGPVKEILPGISYDGNRYVLPVYHIGNGPEFARALFIALGNPGVVILHDVDLTETWNEMLRLGLVSASRLDIEKQLDDLVGRSDSKLAATLVMGQKAIFVFDASIEKVVTGLVKKCGGITKVCLGALPTPGLVYEDALPIKNIDTLTVDESLYSDTPTDYRLNTLLAKSKVGVFGEDAKLQQVLEAMRFGVVASVPTRMRVDESKVSGMVSPSSINTMSDEEYDDAAKAALEALHVHTEHSFVAALSELIEELDVKHG